MDRFTNWGIWDGMWQGETVSEDLEVDLTDPMDRIVEVIELRFLDREYK